MMKYYLLCKQKKNFPKEEEELMASQLLLASLVVPHEKEGGRLLESDTVQMEKRRRLTRLLGSSTLPTRASLKAEIHVKRIYENACEPARQLYDTLEGSSLTALELSDVSRPIIQQIAEQSDGALVHYTEELKVAVCHGVLLKLAGVYSMMRLESFKECMNILPWIEVEKATAAASKNGLVNLRINHAEGTVEFSTDDLTSSAMRNSLISIATTVGDFERAFCAAEIQTHEDQKRKELFETIVARQEEEESEIIHRRHVIEDRKQVREKEELLAEEEQKKRLAEQAAQDEILERQRMEDDAKKRDREREERVKREKEQERNKQVLDSIKEKAGKAGGSIKVGDKTLKDIAVEDLENLDMSELEKARTQQAKKEREGLVRVRKAELKRVDHTARALREETVKILPQWKEKAVSDVAKLIEGEQEKKLADLQQKHAMAVEAKGWLANFVQQKQVWFEEQMVDRRAAFEQKKQQLEKRRLANERRRAEGKVDRARQRKEDYEQEQIQKANEEEERH